MLTSSTNSKKINALSLFMNMALGTSEMMVPKMCVCLAIIGLEEWLVFIDIGVILEGNIISTCLRFVYLYKKGTEIFYIYKRHQ